LGKAGSDDTVKVTKLNYAFAKRQRDIAKKRKKEEKQKLKAKAKQPEAQEESLTELPDDETTEV